MAEQVTKSMWIDWKSHPVTRQFLIQINEWKEAKVAELFEGRTTTERKDREIVGEVRGAEQAMRIAAEEFHYIGDEEDDD